MAPLAGHRAIHVELAEGGIAQHLAEGGQGLQQDLLAVGDQQQRRRLGGREPLGEVGREAGDIEGGEHGLAGAGARRTFHSSPSSRAGAERLEEPM